jgi:hypothetical protein
MPSVFFGDDACLCLHVSGGGVRCGVGLAPAQRAKAIAAGLAGAALIGIADHLRMRRG